MHSIESINVRFQGIVFHKVLVARCSRTICHQGDKFIGKCYFNVMVKYPPRTLDPEAQGQIAPCPLSVALSERTAFLFKT